MPPVNLYCPVCKERAKGLREIDQVNWLIDHLRNQHCDLPPEKAATVDQSSMITGDADISLQDLNADVSAQGRVEIDAAAETRTE